MADIIKIDNQNIIPRAVLQFDFSILMLFRCTKKEYAEQFLEGKLYFGTPGNWINIEKAGNKGQGDLLEGVCLSVLQNDDSELVKQLMLDPELECFDINEYTFFRRKDVLNLRCFCLYGLWDTAFQKEIAFI